jgi:hypothetical protein
MNSERRTCVECGNTFILSYDEQRYFRERNLNLPKHCKDCRARRRYARDAGMRGFSGPTVEPMTGMEASPKPASRTPVMPIPLPLWRGLSKPDHYRNASRFVRLDVSTLSSMSVDEAGLLLQWMFDQNGLEAYAAVAEKRRIDLKLVSREFGWRESACVYLDRNGIPVNALGKLLTDMEGTEFRCVHFCTPGAFSAEQKKLDRESPLILQILEGKQFKQYLLGAQQQFRVQLERRNTPRAYPVQPEMSRWENFKRKMREWLGFK